MNQNDRTSSRQNRPSDRRSRPSRGQVASVHSVSLAGGRSSQSSTSRTRTYSRGGYRTDAEDIRRTPSPAPWLPSTEESLTEDERRRTARRAQRSPRKKSRSVGADVIAYPLSIGGFEGSLSGRKRRRSTTTRNVQGERGEMGVSVRPAVYTQKKVGLRERVHIARRWGTGLHLNMWYVALAALLVIAIAIAAIMGPLRSYYTAWREAGELEVEYEVVSEVNESLTHDVERLNTLEGIEDEARRRGYVYPDEEAMVVEGVEEEQVTEQGRLEEALEEYENSLPWYVHLLDDLLGYSRKR